MSTPTIPGLSELGVPLVKKMQEISPPLNIEGKIQKIIPKTPEKPKDERSLPEKALDWGARRVAPAKPDTQQVREWSYAQKIKNFYKSSRYQSLSQEQKYAAEQWLYKNKVAPGFQKSNKQAPSFEDWVKFRSDPNFPNAQIHMFDYWDKRGTAGQIAEDLGGRVTRSIYGGLENLFMLHAVGLDYLHGNVKPEELDTSKLSSFDLSIYNFLEKAKAGASQKIDKNSPVNASWGRKIAEGAADNALMFTIAGKVGTSLGAATATEGVTGLAGRFPWAVAMAQSPIGRIALNRIIGATDSATAQAMSGGGISPEKVAFGALGPRGIPGPIQKIFKTKAAQNLPGQVLEDISPEAREAAQKLGANLGVTIGAKATAAVAHGAAIRAESGAAEQVNDPIVEKTTKATITLYDRIAREHGIPSYRDIPAKYRPAFLKTVLDEMIQGMKNPAAVDPELTKFLVQHDSAEAASKLPEYAQNVRAIEQFAKAQGLDSSRVLADETFKEASKDLPQTQFRPATTEEIKAKQKAAGMDPLATVLLPSTRLESGPPMHQWAQRTGYLPHPPVQLPPEEGKLFGLDPTVKTPTPQQYPYMPTEKGVPPTVTPMSIKPSEHPKWGTWDPTIIGLPKPEGAPSQAIKPKVEAPTPKPTKEPGMGPGAAHKGDIAFEDVLRHLTRGDIAIENELHQFVQVWGMYKDQNKLTPEIEQNVIDVIKNNLPSGVNERYVTPKLLDKWWSKMKFHLSEMGRTGHIPEGGDPRGMFRSTKLGGQPTIWQEQLYSEPTVKEAPKKGVYRKPKLLGAED